MVFREQSLRGILVLGQAQNEQRYSRQREEDNGYYASGKEFGEPRGARLCPLIKCEGRKGTQCYRQLRT